MGPIWAGTLMDFRYTVGIFVSIKYDLEKVFSGNDTENVDYNLRF